MSEKSEPNVLRVRTTVTLETLVDLDSYGGMTLEQAIEYETGNRNLADRLMEFSEMIESVGFIERLEDIAPAAGQGAQGHIVTVATPEVKNG